jgi:5'-AMP-activated protein kinase catalytic alpha subunit
MEYVPSGELYNLIERRGRLPESEARKYFQQIISAIEYCHDHGVSHRDIKPENILVDNEKNIKVGDFGLSNYMKDGEFFKTSCGSPNYAAPEVISGLTYCGPEVDIWSCGVVLYALLSGYLPFDESNISALFSKIKSANYTIPTQFSEDSKDLIQRMLNPDPIGRITIR